MKLSTITLCAFVLFGPASSSLTAPADAPTLEAAQNAFQQGQFEEARSQCDAFLMTTPDHVEALVLSGRLALYSNKFDDARRCLDHALRVAPDDKKAKAVLAETDYRQDHFEAAAALLQSLGKVDVAAKLRSFASTTPYRVDGTAPATTLKMVAVDPLPVVRVRVNDGEEVNFLIDTGGGETIIDPTLAAAAQVHDFGAETGTFAGGKKASVGQGRVEAMTLGDFKLANVPVRIQDTTPFASALGDVPVRGVIGTALLYHFLATLDYPRGVLILRRPTEENRQLVYREFLAGGGGMEIPFWLAGDHYLLARGTVNRSSPLLFCVDTGLAGGGFVCPDSTLKEAAIPVRTDQSTEGVGGGGRVQASPFTVDALTLGEASATGIAGFAGVFPPPLENVFGFRIAGLISHDFFRPYALTFDFHDMKLLLRKSPTGATPAQPTR